MADKLPPDKHDEGATLFKIILIVLGLFFLGALLSDQGAIAAGKLLQASLDLFK